MTLANGLRRPIVVLALVAVTAGPAYAQTGHEEHPPAPPQHPEGHQPTPPQSPAPDLPPLTDEDRRAAFPDVNGHTVHDTAIHYYLLFDQLEWQTGGGANGFSIDNKGWVGGDLSRFWFRVEGDAEGGDFEEAQAHALYGRAIARWWDVVAGIRQDFVPGKGQTWGAIGIQGLAPYWFEVEATGYVGESGRTHVRLEVEYELLLTNRLVLQPVVELEIYGKDIPENGIAAGLSTSDMGLRLRYELRRELAPYLGITWSRKYGGTADVARAEDNAVSTARLALGLRAWF